MDFSIFFSYIEHTFFYIEYSLKFVFDSHRIYVFIDFAKLNYMIKLTFNHLFKLVEPAGNKEEKMLKYDIGIALGKIRIKQNINIWNFRFYTVFDY